MPVRPPPAVLPMRCTEAPASLGDVVVHHVGFDALDVEQAGAPPRRSSPPRSRRYLAAAQPLEHALAQRLAHVAVEGRHRVAARLEPFGDLRRGGLGAGEDQHRLGCLGFQQTGERVELLRLRDQEIALLDGRHGERLVLDGDLSWRGEMFLGDAPHLRRHGGGEESCLAPCRGGRRLGEDPLHVFEEAHAQHLVSLVQHRHAQAVEAQRAATQVIHDPARRADDHLHAALQAPLLIGQRLSAVDRQHDEPLQVLAVGVKRLGDLHGQLACGREHDRLYHPLSGIDRLQQGGRKPRSCRCRSVPDR